MEKGVLLKLIAPTYDNKGQAKSGQAKLSRKIGVPQPTISIYKFQEIKIYKPTYLKLYIS